MSAAPDIYRRKKMEIIVEAPLAATVIDWLAARGIKGWTVLPTVAGYGHQGQRGGADPAGVLGNVMIIAVTEEAIARAALAESSELLRGIAGIVLLSDVEVRRPDHF